MKFYKKIKLFFLLFLKYFIILQAVFFNQLII